MVQFSCKSILGSGILLLAFIGVQAQSEIPRVGTFDGKIENASIILVTEKSDSLATSGYFVLNRGRAVEDSHTFRLDRNGNKVHFQSDLYAGKMKVSQQSGDRLDGVLSLSNRKKRFFFFPQKASLSFVRRADDTIHVNHRYEQPVYDRWEVRSDLLYAKAKGYWTRSPYSDDPYIEVLRKGLVKTFQEQDLLDLKLDVYYPKGDVFKNRPLVLLIHGGAFYIGSKESAAEQKLAITLAQSGFVVASIDYRLGFKLLASDIEMGAYRALQDAHAALRYLSYNAKGLGINPSQVYVGGTSAGAVASLNLAFMDNDERPESINTAYKNGLVGNIESSGNKYPSGFTIKGVFNLWGAVPDVSIIDKDENIPVLSIHGTADEIVPYGYDYPFQNSLYVNRMIMNKMYGSKPIHDRLNALGIRNRLVPLKGAGHEPELVNYKTLNHYMDTIVSNVSRFLYEETAPMISLPPAQLTVTENSAVKSIYYEVTNGNVADVQAIGGLKVNADPKDASVIWIRNKDKRELIIRAHNAFDAWATQTYPVTIAKP